MKIALLFIFTFLSLSETAVFADDNLIQSTCKNTPYYKLCVSAFKSDPRSANADVKNLGLISVDIIEAKSAYALSLIKKLLKNPKDPQARKVLIDCRRKYKYGLLMGDVLQAREAISSGNYKFAVDATSDAAREAESCGQGFSKSSQMSDISSYVHDISIVALTIVHIINGY